MRLVISSSVAGSNRLMDATGGKVDSFLYDMFCQKESSDPTVI